MPSPAPAAWGGFSLTRHFAWIGASCCELRRFARKRNLALPVRQNNPTGKSLLIFRKRVKPRNQKYFAFPEGQIRGIYLPIPSCSEGRRPSSRTLGGVRWTLRLRLTSAAEAYGEVVWSWRRGGGVTSLG